MTHDMGFGYSSDCDWEIFTDAEIEVLENLPHGSGINCDWFAERLTTGRVMVHNSYQVMSESGYIGYADFSVTFSAEKPEDFRLCFHGRRAQYLASYYQLRDYLEETIHYNITS